MFTYGFRNVELNDKLRKMRYDQIGFYSFIRYFINIVGFFFQVYLVVETNVVMNLIVEINIERCDDTL